MNTIIQDNKGNNEQLKSMSEQDLRYLGMNEIAYIRPTSAADESEGFAIHAADGTQLSVMEDYDTAIAAARQNELEPIMLQ
jgi:hypothetical protein